MYNLTYEASHIHNVESDTISAVHYFKMSLTVYGQMIFKKLLCTFSQLPYKEAESYPGDDKHEYIDKQKEYIAVGEDPTKLQEQKEGINNKNVGKHVHQYQQTFEESSQKMIF